jgi:hypothetical protein
MAGHARRVDLDAHGTARATHGDHLARAGNPFQLGLDAVRHALQVIGASLGVAAEECERDDGHVVDALGFDDRIEHAQASRQPVGIGVDRVVQPHQRFGARHAHLELHGDDRHAWPRHRHHVLDAGDLRQHLLGRCGHHLLDITHRRPGKRDQHIGHGHVDLRLFLARRHQHREDAQQQRHQRQQWRDLRRLEVGRDATRDTERAFRGHAQSARAAACGSSATRSPADTPDSTSTLLPCARPSRTWRSTGAPCASSTYTPVSSARRSTAEAGT